MIDVAAHFKKEKSIDVLNAIRHGLNEYIEEMAFKSIRTPRADRLIIKLDDRIEAIKNESTK